VNILYNKYNIMNIQSCYNSIDRGANVRIYATLVSFIVLANYMSYPVVNKYSKLIIVILLFVLDLVDGIHVIYNDTLLQSMECFTINKYHKKDKIIDTLSYLYVYLLFDLDNIALYFILFRLLGVIIYNFTNNKIYIIIFFDFIKEYILYRFIFGDNNKYLYWCIFAKILYEISHHFLYDKIMKYNMNNKKYKLE